MTRQYNGVGRPAAGRQSRYYVSDGLRERLRHRAEQRARGSSSTHANLTRGRPEDRRRDEPQLLSKLAAPRRRPRRVGAARRAGRTHRCCFPRLAASSDFPPEVPQHLYDNADGVNRFTGSATLTNRLDELVHAARDRRVRLHGEDARAIEHFAPPDLAPFLRPRSAGGSIGQTLRHNSIITADYSGTAKVNITSALVVDHVVRRAVLQHRAQYAASSAGSGFPAPGVETVSAVSTRSPRHADANDQHHDRRVRRAAVRVARPAVRHGRRCASTTTARSAKTSSG